MKKTGLLSLILAAVLTLSAAAMIACDNDKTTTDETTAEETAAETDADAEAEAESDAEADADVNADDAAQG